MEKLPKDLQAALEKLRDYMHNFHPDLDRGAFPVEFWRNPDDDLYWETLLYFPLFVPEETRAALDSLPMGFRIAFPVFWLEDDYQVNGDTALTNAGEWLLPSAIWAFTEIGMQSEVRALHAALESVRRNPEDDEAAGAAYRAAAGPNQGDEREGVLFAFFTANRALFEA
ncbi:hypothetical protein BWI17_02290 [Betaproteobacteria bacterium GR16-43]|nr:hypothetical protein BWI17_02290 [Betaproteobacteria bacterium GR16-43]